MFIFVDIENRVNRHWQYNSGNIFIWIDNSGSYNVNREPWGFAWEYVHSLRSSTVIFIAYK